MVAVTQRQWILAKLEGANYATDSSPTSANGIQCVSLDVQPLVGDSVEQTRIRPSFGGFKKLMANQRHVITVTVEFTSSGTAGTAPAWSPLMLSCASAQTITASAVTGSATAGGTNTITLASGASAVDGFYLGMRIANTSGTGNGNYGVITGYVGSTKVATVQPYTGTYTAASATAYSIGANVLYSPITQTDGVTDTSCTIYFYDDNILFKATGCRGTWSGAGPSSDRPTLTFTMEGIINPVTDTSAVPPTSYTNQVDALLFDRDGAGAVSFLGYSPCVESFTFDAGVSLAHRNLVGCTRKVLANGRASSGSVTFEMPTIAQKNYFAAAQDNSGASDGIFTVSLNGAAGRTVTLLAPNCHLGQLTRSSSQGIEMLNAPFDSVPTVGNDEWRLVLS
jgi:hypothetical protein